MTRQTSPRRRGAESDIADALAELAWRRPKLAPLVAAVTRRADGSHAMRPRFFRELEATRAVGAKDVVRALFADPSLFRTELMARFTPALAERAIAYLAALPSQPFQTGHVARNEVPKPLFRIFGHPRLGTGLALVNEIAVLLWTHRLGERVVPPRSALPGLEHPSVLRVLAPLLDARFLSEERARKLVSESLTSQAYEWFFATPFDALNVRNASVLAAVILDGPRNGGRVQNKIPLQLSRRFRLKPRSVPDLLPLFDVLTLAYDGVLRIPAKDPLRLRELFETPVPGGREAFWEPVIARHRGRAFVGADYELQAEDGGTFETSLRFNAARATGLIDGRRARLARFAPYYKAIVATRLQARCAKVWGAIAPALRRECKALAKSRTLSHPAVRVRDLGNILARDALYPTEDNPLPSVALFALGQAEPVPKLRRGKKGKKGTKAMKRRRGRSKVNAAARAAAGALLVSKLRNKLSGSRS